MLLWLTLALLGTSCCWASEMYGLGEGTTFTSFAEDEEDITGIRVCIGALGLFKSIQLRFGTSWSIENGIHNSGRCQEFILKKDEHFIEVYGTYKVFFQCLLLRTSNDRVAMFGNNQGKSFWSYPNNENNVLRGVFGQYKPLGISGLGFHWGALLELTNKKPQDTSF